MTPKTPLHDGRPHAHDLRDQKGDLATGFANFGLRCALAVFVMGLAYIAYAMFGGPGLYIFLLLFGAWWLHRELAWIEANVPPEE